MMFEMGRPFATEIIDLTDDQVKALPTTPQLLLQPPSNQMIFNPVQAFIVADTRKGAYGNVSSNKPFILFAGSDPYNNGVEIGCSCASTGVVGLSPLTLAGCAILENATINTFGFVIPNGAYAPLSLTDTSIWLGIITGGDFTGGDPSNTFRVTTTYSVIQL